MGDFLHSASLHSVMDPALAFFATGAIGGALTMLAFALTRSLPWHASATIRALIVAMAFTPSIALYLHGVVLMPAVLVLALAPFMMQYGWPYALVFGAVPIALVWGALRFWWPPQR
jgi:hypothetical protein